MSSSPSSYFRVHLYAIRSIFFLLGKQLEVSMYSMNQASHSDVMFNIVNLPTHCLRS